MGVYGKELKMNKNKLIALNKKFHGYEDVEEDNEPEYIESDLGDLIIKPKYNNDKELKQAQAKLKPYEEEYILLNINLDDDDNDIIDIQDAEIKLKQYEEEDNDKQEFPKYFMPVINEVMDIYNTVMINFPIWPQLKLSSMSDKRKWKIKNLWDKHILKDTFEWEEYFFIVKNSDFHKDEKFGNIDGLFTEGLALQILEGKHGAFIQYKEKPDFYYRQVNGVVEWKKKVDGRFISANPNFS